MLSCYKLIILTSNMRYEKKREKVKMKNGHIIFDFTEGASYSLDSNNEDVCSMQGINTDETQVDRVRKDLY